MQPLLESIANSSLGVYVREGLYTFAWLVGIHIFSLMWSAGILLWFDLRLLGIGLRHGSTSDIYRRLRPYLTVGFAMMFLTGAVLFVGYATEAYANIYFRIKMLSILLAGVNALVYHLVTERRVAEWDAAGRPPIGARVAGAVSMSLWAIVIICGRMMSYTIF